MDFKKQIIEDYFKDLKFYSEGHKYLINNKEILSVSSLLYSFIEKIDWSKKTAKTEKKLGISQAEVLKLWEENKNNAAKKGSKVHHYAEHEIGFRIPESPQEVAILKFFLDLNQSRYKIIHKELSMYHKKYYYSGTSDLIIYDTFTDTYIIADYKTNSNLFKNFAEQKLLYPFDELLDSPYSKYELQLSFYQILLEQTGIKVSERWLIWVKEDGEYEIYKTNDYTERLENWLTDKTFYK